MRPIGFSTGALAKGDFARGLDLQRRVPRIGAVELSALRDHELPELITAIPALDLGAFAYVSFHAPGRLQSLDEKVVFELLLQLPASWPVVVHPELLRTRSLWIAMGERLCLENMDQRKTTGRTVDELRALFEIFPDATFCLDLGHARQIDPTMASALLMLRTFGDRLRQVHVSDARRTSSPRRNGTALVCARRASGAGRLSADHRVRDLTGRDRARAGRRLRRAGGRAGERRHGVAASSSSPSCPPPDSPRATTPPSPSSIVAMSLTAQPACSYGA